MVHIKINDLIFITFTLLFIAIFSLTFTFSPLNGEDFGVSRMSQGHSFFDQLIWIIDRSNHMWSVWNARLGARLAIFWLNMPQYIFDAASTLMFTLFFWIITILATGQKQPDSNKLAAMAATAAVTILFWPRLEVFFWRDVSAGYLQPLLITLFVICVVSIKDMREYFYRSNFRYFIAIIAAFLSGMSFENTPPALVVYLFANSWFAYKKFAWKQDAGLASAILAGWLALVLAPSTAIRIAYYEQAFKEIPRIELYIGRAVNTVTTFAQSSWLLLILGIISLLLLLRRFGFRENLDIILLLIPATLSSGAVLMAPYSEPRAFSFAWAVIVVMIVRALAKLVNRNGLILVCILAVGVSFSTFQSYLNFYEQAHFRDRYIRSHIGSQKCIEGLPVPPLTTDAGPRILNNRDGWFFNSLKQVDRYYHCKVLLRK